jgi:uncharacterized membrane protein YhaH (DUF805 family)
MDWTYLFFGLEGRISRKSYWIASAVLIPAAAVCVFAAAYFDQRRLMSIIELAFLYPDFAVLIKRAHDRDMNYWLPTLYLTLSALLSALSALGFGGPDDNPTILYLLVAIPYVAVALYLVFVLGFLKGTPGPNRFGMDPLARQGLGS